ncbi:hypothetical protein Tco_0575079 [Tanacetum coccineum]
MRLVRLWGRLLVVRDSCLIALQNKQNELEKYIAFNDWTIDYEILQTKLNDTLGLLALKDIEIKEGLKTKAYEISVLNQKHDELVKKSLLTNVTLERLISKRIIQIPYDTSDLAIRFAPDREETMTLANESRSKLNKDYVKPYDYTKHNRKDNKDKKKQKRSKTDKERKRQDKSEDGKSNLKAGLARYKRESQSPRMKVKESMLTSLQSSRFHLDD